MYTVALLYQVSDLQTFHFQAEISQAPSEATVDFCCRFCCKKSICSDALLVFEGQKLKTKVKFRKNT